MHAFSYRMHMQCCSACIQPEMQQSHQSRAHLRQQRPLQIPLVCPLLLPAWQQQQTAPAFRAAPVSNKHARRQQGSRSCKSLGSFSKLGVGQMMKVLLVLALLQTALLNNCVSCRSYRQHRAGSQACRKPLLYATWQL
jgi:hypothetical protein